MHISPEPLLLLIIEHNESLDIMLCYDVFSWGLMVKIGKYLRGSCEAGKMLQPKCELYSTL